jgi:hypothetical protein
MYFIKYLMISTSINQFVFWTSKIFGRDFGFFYNSIFNADVWMKNMICYDKFQN